MDLHSFDTLANELVQHIAGFLDAQTLLSFVSTSHQYKQFEYPVQERWKILYSNNWCVDLQELECYEK
jgi:predicted transposase YbfD/YdcC